MTHHLPDDTKDSEPENITDDVHGPSQRDIERSWDGYESGRDEGGADPRRIVWKAVIVMVSLVILASMTLGIIGPLFGGSQQDRQVQPERIAANVLRVIDGRTIIIDAGQGEQIVRLIGIKTPEFGDPFYNFSREVSQSWIGGKSVMLEADQLEIDSQGHLLRYVFFENIMINAALMLNGLGTIETELPNVRYDNYLKQMELQARESEVGIWDSDYRGSSFNAPQAFSEELGNSPPKFASSDR